MDTVTNVAPGVRLKCWVGLRALLGEVDRKQSCYRQSSSELPVVQPRSAISMAINGLLLLILLWMPIVDMPACLYYYFLGNSSLRAGGLRGFWVVGRRHS